MTEKYYLEWEDPSTKASYKEEITKDFANKSINRKKNIYNILFSKGYNEPEMYLFYIDLVKRDSEGNIIARTDKWYRYGDTLLNMATTLTDPKIDKKGGRKSRRSSNMGGRRRRRNQRKTRRSRK